MPTVEQSIEVEVPVTTAYSQWTQFEEFPTFMNGVEEVRQLDDTHLHWVAEIGGHREEWDAEITEQHPDSHACADLASAETIVAAGGSCPRSSQGTTSRRRDCERRRS